MAARFLITIGVIWPIALATLILYQLPKRAIGWGIDVPVAGPLWATYLYVVVAAAVFWLGWIVPLATGIRLLRRSS